MRCNRNSTPHYNCQIDKERCHLLYGGDCYKMGKAQNPEAVLSNSTGLLSVEVIKYLEDNLKISMEQVTKFGPVEVIKVTLELGGKVISESDCSLPDRDT